MAGIVSILTSLVTLAALLFYILIALLPIPFTEGPAPATGESVAQPATRLEPSERDVNLFGVTWKMSDEERLLILVMTAGALGSLVHALRSAYWYVGNRNLVRSWIPKYLLLPFCGAILAVLFYFVVRGGFFSPQANSMHTSQYGFLRPGLLGRSLLGASRAQAQTSSRHCLHDNGKRQRCKSAT